MRSFRITPLNLLTAVLIFLTLYVALYGASFAGENYARWQVAMALLFLLFAVASFVLDLIFRNFFPQTRRLWIVELAFIAFTAVVFLILNR